MRDLVQEIKEIEELNRLFPPIPVTSHGPAEQITDHEEATNDLASSLRRELKALTLDDNHDAEDNLNSVSPPPYRQVAPPMYECDEQGQEPNCAPSSPAESIHHEEPATPQHPAFTSPWMDSPRFCGGPGKCSQCNFDHRAYELMYSQLTRVQQEYRGRDPANLPPKYMPGVCERCTEMRVPGRRACVFHIFENYFRATHRLNIDGTDAPPLQRLCSRCLRPLVSGEVLTCRDCFHRFFTPRVTTERGWVYAGRHLGPLERKPEEETEEATFVPVRRFL
ncbi:uncharacterized protein LAJ45_01092 [Morchella importuna]|uniref:uncharacterized protein n=1 Tax=Morchella importuna TaxID=1174673 RepID=UPI001E8D16CE|nr:uncharacterized protein LAJ45_01092 [Morchella importuna]KAH8154564.1 hypothetical protein LAJ45_01092 [Morchella importuna]